MHKHTVDTRAHTHTHTHTHASHTHTHTWCQTPSPFSAWQVVARLLRPARTPPGTAWETFMLSLSDGDVPGM